MSRADRHRPPAPVRRKGPDRRRATRSRAVRTGVVLLSVALATLGLLLWQSAKGSGHAASPPSLPLAFSSSLGSLSAPPDPGPLGPEGVPIPSARPLARANAPAPRDKVDGISAAPLEQLAFHIHAHLTVFIDGVPRLIPYGVGIAPPLEVEPTVRGPFALGGTAFFWLHTHSSDGIIHIESPIERTYTLGNFFDIWNEPLGRKQVGPATGHVTAFSNGRHYLGNPRDIPLLAHAQIQLDVGRPLVAPESIHFPAGL